MISPPVVTVVRGKPVLSCPCGRGFLGHLPVSSAIDHRERTLTVVWYCKSCNHSTSAVFALGDGIWTHEQDQNGKELPQ